MTKAPENTESTDEKNDNPDKYNEDPIVTYIMEALEAGDEVSPNHIAQTIARDRASEHSTNDYWRKFLTAVRQQAIHLARTEKIEIVRKGKVADPNNFKGLYKLRLPRK
jgi:Protein of unknown function (DUF3253)